MRKKNSKCLMLEITDQKRLFTQEKNFPLLIEFAKTFNSGISVVKLEQGEIMDLSTLATAISNPNYQRPSKFSVLEIKLPKSCEPTETSVPPARRKKMMPHY